jgi:hypothetical protein
MAGDGMSSDRLWKEAPMDNLVEHHVLSPKHIALLWSIYEAACQVVAKYPDTHVACIAAKRLIAAFSGEIYRDETWLRTVAPHGST